MSQRDRLMYPALLLMSVLIVACSSPASAPVGNIAPDTIAAAEPAEPRGALPPDVTLEIGDQAQTSGAATYCWTHLTSAGWPVSTCADAVSIVTPREPLSAIAPLEVRFRLDAQEAPSQLLLEAVPVTPKDKTAPVAADTYAWPVHDGEHYVLPAGHAPEVDLALEPGLYVLSLWAQWESGNDANYGFLVEVSTPVLTVEEYPIVTASEDSPGHFEYMHRISSEILAKRQASKPGCMAPER